MLAELLDLVDADDAVIGQADRGFILKNKIHNYRVVGIFLLDQEKRILVPTRSMTCLQYPGCYDFSVAGHVQSGESYAAAAYREAAEEFGIPRESLSLKEFLYAKYPNEYGLSSFSKYYYGFYSSGILQKNAAEVSDYKFMTFDELLRLFERQPELFKSDFGPVYRRFYGVRNEL